ncbi:hypothetical protein MHB43_20385 [Paenibacillus sp. FSL H8-0317]|uniref:hypothetical protein n=1 Tax=Paenibacillus sp. FSL H8-0317 TaxID=2921385 RepID=UPI003246A068
MSKQEEIKQALAAATPGPWIAKDDSVAAGNDWVCQMYEGDPDCECDFNEFPNAEMNAGFIAMAPEYIAYLLADNERLEQRNQELDTWATEGFEENQKLVKERDSLLTALQEETKQCKKAIMLLVQVTDTLSTGRTPDRAGAALKQIFKWLNENHPVGQEGEGHHEPDRS